MRGFILFLEALLTLLILFAFVVQFFVPAPDSYGIAEFLAKNDEVSAKMDAGVPIVATPYFPREKCLDVRYLARIYGSSVVLVPVCVR